MTRLEDKLIPIAVTLWNMGMDTWAIAHQLNVHEALVANSLGAEREERRARKMGKTA